MPTLNVAYNNAAIVMLAKAPTLFPGYAGRDAFTLSEYGGEVNVTLAPAETVTFAINSGSADPIEATVNGVVSTPTVAGDNAWHDISLYNSTSATVTIRLRNVSTGAVALGQTLFSATHSSSTPVASQPTALQHVYNLSSSDIRKEDAPSGSFVLPVYWPVWNDAKLRLKGPFGSIKLWAYQNGNAALRLAKNGVYVGNEVSLPNTGLYDLLTLGSSLGGAAGNEWVIHYSVAAATGGGPSVAGAYLVLDAALEAAPVFNTPTRQIMVEGDSLTQTSAALLKDSSYGWVDQAALQVGSAIVLANRGIYGSTISTTGGTSPLVDRIAAHVTAFEPTELDLLIGTNDLQLGTAEATVKADFKTAIGNAIGAYAGLTKIRIYALLPRNDASESGRASFNTNVLAAAATELQASNPTLTITYSTVLRDAITTPLSDIETGGVHLTQQGEDKLAAAWAGILAPVTPSSGSALIRSRRSRYNLNPWDYDL